MHHERTIMPMTGRWRRAAATLASGLAPWRALAAAEQRAAIAEQRLVAVLEAIPEGVVLLDAEGRYRLWNAAYAEIYHRSADQFAVGRKLVEGLRVGAGRGDYPGALARADDWCRES